MRSVSCLASSSWAPGRNDREFFAAITGHAASVLHILRQHGGEDIQDLIADRMAEGIVDLLEVVDIPHDQAKRATQCLRLGDGLGEVGIKATPIVERGQRIAQADRLRLGKRRMQLFDLRLGDLQPCLEVGRLLLRDLRLA